MYILNIFDEERETPWVCFHTIEEAESFLTLLPGYSQSQETEWGIDRWIDVPYLPDYDEISYNGNMIPISRFMFKSTEKVELYLTELPNLSRPNQGMVDGATTIDAYSIPNSEVQKYVTDREDLYQTVKKMLEDRGLEADRHFHGSEDGEAIMYRKPKEKEWHFLAHMDPSFVSQQQEGDDSLQKWLRELLS